MASFNRWIFVDDYFLVIGRCRERRARHRRMSMEVLPVSEVSASALLRRKTVEELKKHQVFMRRREEADQSEITEIVELPRQEKEFGAVMISAPSTPQSVLCDRPKDLNGDSSSDSSITQRQSPPNPPPPPPLPPKVSLFKKHSIHSSSQKQSISDWSSDGLICSSGKQNMSGCSSDGLIGSRQEQSISVFSHDPLICSVQHKSIYNGSIEALIGSINALIGSSQKQNCSSNGSTDASHGQNLFDASRKQNIPPSSGAAVIASSEKQTISYSSIGLEGSCQEQDISCPSQKDNILSSSKKLPCSPQKQSTPFTSQKDDTFLCSSENVLSSRQNQEITSSPSKQSIPSSHQKHDVPSSPPKQNFQYSPQKHDVLSSPDGQNLPVSPQKQSIPSSPQKQSNTLSSLQKHTFNPSTPLKQSNIPSSPTKQNFRSSSQKQNISCSSHSFLYPPQTSESSFILDRFLPAAQAIADRSPATRIQQTPSTPKTVKWSSSPEIIDVQHQPVPTASARSIFSPTIRRHDSKSCGFLTLGFKSALSRAHRSAFGSEHSFSSSRSRSMPHPLKLHRHDADSPCSSEDEQFSGSSFSGPWKPKSALVPPSISFSSTSPMSYRVSSPNFAPGYLRDISPRASVWSTQSTPVHVHSEKLHNQTLTSNMPREYQTFNKADLHANQSIDINDDNQINGTALRDEPLEAKPEHAGLNGNISNGRINDFPQFGSELNNLPDEQDRAQVVAMNENAEDSMAASSGSILNKPWKDESADFEDDDVPFFDALSRLNSSGSTPGTLTPCTIGSPKPHHEAYAFPTDWTHDESGFLDTSSQFETPRASTSENNFNPNGNNLLSDPKGKPLSLSQRVGKALKLQTSGTEPDKGSMSPDVPLRSILRHQPRSESFSGRFRHISFDVINDDVHSTGLASPVFPAKCQQNGANDLGWPFGISSCQYPGTGQDKLSANRQSQNQEDGLNCNIPAPPLPPAPAGSWLQKAMASRASKPSTLATLQQKQKVHPATVFKDLKHIEATRKDVSWEDVVKGSRTQGLHHHRHHRHHHHPSNHGTLKPLRL